MSISFGDTPPNGVAVLFFEALITGATLQPSGTTQSAVSVLNNPVEVEFTQLQTDTAFLSMRNVPPGTYSSINLTFGDAALTFINHSGAAIGACANGAVCQTSPSFNSSTVNVTNSSFPLTIDQNSVLSMKLDFDVNSSIQSNLSVTPTVTIAHVKQRTESDQPQEMENFDEVDGIVTAVGTNQFTLSDEQSGQSFTINVNSSTVYQGFARAGCSANPAGFTCIQIGQILDVDLSDSGTSTMMLAQRVEFEAAANQRAIKAIVASVDSATQFEAVVFNEEPTVGGLSEGSPVTVVIQPNASFMMGLEELGEDGGFNFPGLLFSTTANMLVGQDVQFHPVSSSTTGGVTTVTTDLVGLWPSQITGTVGAINSNGGFTLTNLSPLFTGATPPITTINVVVLSHFQFMDNNDMGSATLAVGQTVSVKGLLFNTSPTPTLVTRTMQQQFFH